MPLHARNVAAAAGAEVDEIEAVVARLKAMGHVRLDKAEAILLEIREGTS